MKLAPAGVFVVLALIAWHEGMLIFTGFLFGMAAFSALAVLKGGEG